MPCLPTFKDEMSRCFDVHSSLSVPIHALAGMNGAGTTMLLNELAAVQTDPTIIQIRCKAD